MRRTREPTHGNNRVVDRLRQKDVVRDLEAADQELDGGKTRLKVAVKLQRPDLVDETLQNSPLRLQNEPARLVDRWVRQTRFRQDQRVNVRGLHQSRGLSPASGHVPRPRQ
jgi:hypothetical protein